jgi:hypothetical protein
MKILFCLLAAAALLCGCKKSADFMAQADDNEKYPHKLARYRASAEAGVRDACTNYTVGLRGILYLRADTSADNFMQWTAKATVEFINPVGGVDRTNLEFKPSVMGGQMRWFQK